MYTVVRRKNATPHKYLLQRNQIKNITKRIQKRHKTYHYVEKVSYHTISDHLGTFPLSSIEDISFKIA